MKKLINLTLLAFIANSINAQFITTNPSTTPITLSAPVNITEDLNLSAGKAIKFNGTKMLQSFGTGNFAIGITSGNILNAGARNISIGQGSSQLSTLGSDNVYVGYTSGYQNNGNNNVGLGYGTLAGVSTGGGNAAFGYNAGGNNTGNENVFFGTTAGFNNQGYANAFLGNQAGVNNTTGNYNLFLGMLAKSSNPASTGGVAIGFSAIVDTDWGIVLGDALNPLVKVGIGTSAPSEKLHVKGGGVRFENLPVDGVGGTAVQYVVIDASGKLYKYSGTAPLRQGVSEDNSSKIPSASFNENWTLKNDYLFNKNKKGIIIGEGISSMPKGYGMYVTEGILTEKVKVAIKNSSDWADYVFAKNYNKMSLTDVEKYINTNKHLPNVPSAAEMVLEGNDLAKTDVKLLEKIEELTLYMIEMKKENTQMKKQINSLKRKMNK